MTDNETTQSRNKAPLNESDANILPFRRPSPQPTLPRRPTTATEKHLKSGKGGARNREAISSWKAKALQALQVVLLITGLLLALRNCGKI